MDNPDIRHYKIIITRLVPVFYHVH